MSLPKARRKTLVRFGTVFLFLIIIAGVAFFMHPVVFFQKATEARMLLSGTRSRWVTVDGYRVHYYVAGPEGGAPIVLVHGLGGRSEDWANVAPYLERAGLRVYMPDMLGYGQSEQPASFSYSIRDEARVVVDWLDTLGLKQVDLGGWSMGGWIVQLIAANHPGRVQKLLLFDSAGIYVRPSWNTDLFTPTTALELAELDGLLMPHPPQVPGFVARDILGTSRRNAWVTRRAMASMLTGRDTTDALLPGFKMPVMIVWGAEDHITPLSEGQTIHNLVPRSQLLVIDGCGHLAPGQCAAQIGPGVVAFVTAP